MTKTDWDCAKRGCCATGWDSCKSVTQNRGKNKLCFSCCCVAPMLWNSTIKLSCCTSRMWLRRDELQNRSLHSKSRLISLTISRSALASSQGEARLIGNAFVEVIKYDTGSWTGIVYSGNAQIPVSATTRVQVPMLSCMINHGIRHRDDMNVELSNLIHEW